MIAKLYLVMYLMAGRGDVQIQYIVKYPTEEACMKAAEQYKSSKWQAYPVKRAECVFDITASAK